jgi:putative addiction module component (TIGR02574 family)
VTKVGFALEWKQVSGDSCHMVAEKIPQLKGLSSEEKLILVGELWDQLAADPAAFPVRDDHLKILESRLTHFREHPEDVTAWEEVKKRILSSR